MLYGALPRRPLPQQDTEKVVLLAHRWERAAHALKLWAEGADGRSGAKRCYDFFEGRQWTPEQIATLEGQGRLALKWNKLGRLVRLVLGYHQNNKTQAKFLPAADAVSTQEVADVLNLLSKQIDKDNLLDYVDDAVFLDGLVGGRGYYDSRLDFTENDFGDIRIRSVDPFTVYVDPDLQDYDLNKGGFVAESRWVSVDEIEHTYGREAAEMVRPYTAGNGWNGFPTSLYVSDMEVTPVRGFGLEEDLTGPYGAFRDLFNHEMVDAARKNIRLIDMQHYVTEMSRVFVDLETGDRSPVPAEWDEQRVAKALYYAESMNNPLRVVWRPVRKPRWTTLVGDLMVHDDWSPYHTFTLTGFFAYFRRGVTGGMVEDLIDPQRGINKWRAAAADIVSRTANSGWMYEENTLNPDQERNLEEFGAAPGVIIKYKDGKKPEKIDPSPPPMAMERLERQDTADLNEISGINESALGDLDKVQSGKAIIARQRQAVVAIQMYRTNFSRSRLLLGQKKLNLIQRHYTEERMIRVMGDDGKMVEKIVNRRMMDPTNAGSVTAIANDVSRGKYSVAIDETPLSATFAEAQFEEALNLVKELQGAIPPAAIADILVDMSSLPRKEEIKQRIQQAMGMTALASGTVPMPPGAGGPPPGPMPGGPGPGITQGNVVPMPRTA